MEDPEIFSMPTKDKKDMEPSEVRFETYEGDRHQHRQGDSEKPILDFKKIRRMLTKVKKVILDHEKKIRVIFLLCGVVAVSLDPLFFYIPVINNEKKCLKMDEKLKTAMLVLRSVMDLTYILHIAFLIFFGYLAYKPKGKRLSLRNDDFIDQIMGVIRRSEWRIIIIDILCVLPIPQVVMFVCLSQMEGLESLNTRNFLNIFVFVNFVPRILRIYFSCKQLNENLSPWDIVGAAKALFIFFLYIISTHMTGALWYFFSIQRESACWQYACKGNQTCNNSNFFCDIPENVVDYLNVSCPLNEPSSFDFGMFAPAIQSRIVDSMDLPQKFSYCFAWGLRNLSCFGSNIQTSTYFWENLFSAAITIVGLLLFLYLIGNLQTYLQFSEKDSEKKRREKMKTKEIEINEWIQENGIPSDMTKEITDWVHKKMHENEDVNLKNLLNVLPTESKRCIKKTLCLPILKKVTQLQHMDDKSIDEIFNDHLKPVIFKEDSEIFKQGDHLDQMLFFTKGSAHAYSTNLPTTELERGHFYGEELLEWALTTPSSPVPISQKAVKTKTKVEAFEVSDRDMKKIVNSLRKSKIVD